MQDPVSLQEPFTYSTTIIYVLLTIIVVLIVSLFIKKRKKKEFKQEVKLVHYPDLLSIKNNYLGKLNELQNKVNNNEISNRKAYHSLSKIIRSFIFESTNINVLSLSLSEVKNYKIPYLEELMREYYTPEFSTISKGDIQTSINNAREVINKWR